MLPEPEGRGVPEGGGGRIPQGLRHGGRERGRRAARRRSRDGALGEAGGDAAAPGAGAGAGGVPGGAQVKGPPARSGGDADCGAARLPRGPMWPPPPVPGEGSGRRR